MTIVGERADGKEPTLQVGEIYVRHESLRYDDKGRDYFRRDVMVGDESNRDPNRHRRFLELGNHFEQLVRDNPSWQTKVRDGIVTGVDGNKAAEWLYYDEDHRPTQMLEWAGKFPTAIALEPLQRLENGGKWLSAGGLDQRSLDYFTYMVDGIGLRARARVYTERLVTLAGDRDSLTVVSLGSGAAVPNIDATQRLESLNKRVDWKFYDTNPEALLYAQKLVAEKNFQYSTFDFGPTALNKKTNISEPTGRSFARAFGQVPDGSVDVVDALGLWEYLSEDTARRFFEKLYPKIKPGGSMIVSNMLPDRPQKEFNQRAVGWPGLYLRGDTDLLDIVSKAGIDSANVTMTHTNDGVYGVMEIKR